MAWYDNEMTMRFMKLRKGMPVISPKYGKGWIRNVSVKENRIRVIYWLRDGWLKTQGRYHKVNTVKRYRQRYLNLKESKKYNH